VTTRYWISRLVVAILLFAVLLFAGLYALREVIRDDCPRGNPGDSGGACYDTHSEPEP